MEYCKRCVYPANTQPQIILDDEGVCSGCRVFEKRSQVDWDERKDILQDILNEYSEQAREQGASYDCIIPVSGGKDSHYQVHVISEIYDLDPLLVAYNHTFNTKIGLRNLRNLVEKTGCDLVRYTSNPQTVRKLTKYHLHETGDVTWHYHSGIMTFPIQTAVRYNIPLIIWGEEAYRYKMGMFNPDDMVEFTEKVRQEHDMRGYTPDKILDDPYAQDLGIERSDLGPFRYPSDDEIDEVGVRGIYLDNFMPWDSHAQTQEMIEKYDFATYPIGAHQSGRTFLNYSEIDDAANGMHDYLRYLKYGYGRATDHVVREIRHGRLTREEGIRLVEEYDHRPPNDMDFFLDFLDITEEELEAAIEDMRDTDIWVCDEDDEWYRNDSVGEHVDDDGVDAVRPATDNDDHWSDISNPVTDYKDSDFITL
jgi:N-acetyl sugar amidotransferase